jgi:DNA polymerase (family 10)
MDNAAIADLFVLYGKLLELHGENEFKSGIYTQAGFSFKKLTQNIAELRFEEIISHPQLSKALKNKIPEILFKGTFEDLEKIISITPRGLIEILQVRGLGPKKVRELWTKLGIETPGELLYACQENRLIDLKGFGSKTQDKVKSELEFMELNKSKLLYAKIEETAFELLRLFSAFSDMNRIELTGAFRRKCEVISELEYVADCERIEDFKTIIISMGAQKVVDSENKTIFELKKDFPLIIHFAQIENFESVWFKTTATSEHLAKLIEIQPTDSEEDIYSKNGLFFIPPELREGNNELDIFHKNNENILLKLSDIRGSIHNHSNWSDGKNTIAEMSEHCKELGWEYFCICDHSKSAFYANGLVEERILQQFDEIQELNAMQKGVKVFKGIECDILNDGSLDYEKDVLKQFDLVVASIHSNLSMSEEKAMQRLIKAIENPYTTILGHLTGRLLLTRNGYPVDHKKIIDACAANHVVIELNSNPYRLDIDWKWLDYIAQKNVFISINPDAHNLKGLSDTKYGVYACRKAAFPKELVLNTKNLTDFELFLKENKSKKGI